MASTTNILRSLVFLSMVLLIINVQLSESRIDAACTLLCTKFWACTIKDLFGSDPCVEPSGCNCHEFAL